jgi:hypothetical protein
VINVESFDDLPPPRYSWRNYSGAYFWTTNVSAPLQLIKDAGGFDERFTEYGWEDLELGLRLRRMGVPSRLEREAIVYHYKPRVVHADVHGMVRQARAQARTAVQFMRKHPHWRVALATGQIPLFQAWSAVARAARWPELLETLAASSNGGPARASIRRWAAARLARAAYYEELQRAAQAK